MKRLIGGALVVAGVAALGIFGTQAFFNDTETSTGNIFQAGAIDLLVDNESYVTDATGALVASPNTSWDLDDLTGHLFFNFDDLKPGDIGEDTISLHVNNNDAWLCAAAQVTDDSDVNYTEPELEDDLTVDENDPEGTDGELAENLNFVFWADDGDNVYEVGENVFLGPGPVSAIGAGGQITLADSGNNIWSGSPNDPIEPDDGDNDLVWYIGKAWCFGTLSPDPLDDGLNTSPLERGTGWDCNGADQANNAAQTDRVMGDLQFYAVQSRNNAEFLCSSNYTPEWPTPSPTPTPVVTPSPEPSPTG